MISTRPRSSAARCTLLVVALLHFVATAGLPFTHAHAPVQSAAEVLAQLPGTESGPQEVHTDLCAVCRTLTTAQSGPVLPGVATAPSASVVLDRSHDETAADLQSFTLSQPRAPPIA
ncbi:MAG TPA: hypothetical protein VK912_05020 [Longimicrobiales bacterium]|nr:hypothetical protein [Longimicrobiales bacterium]